MQPWQPMAPMSPAPPGGPARRRPGTVTAGAMLLVLAVVLDLAEVGVVALGLTAQSAHDKQAYGESSGDAKFLTVSFIILIGVNVVLAFGLTGGALAVLRRRMSGLVLACFFGGFAMLLRCGCGGVGGWAWYYDSHTEGVSDPYPSWLYVADIAIDLVALIAILTAVILLLTGTSRRWLQRKA